MGHDEHPPV